MPEDFQFAQSIDAPYLGIGEIDRIEECFADYTIDVEINGKDGNPIRIFLDPVEINAVIELEKVSEDGWGHPDDPSGGSMSWTEATCIVISMEFNGEKWSRPDMRRLLGKVGLEMLEDDLLRTYADQGAS